MKVLVALLFYLATTTSVHADIYLSIMSWGGNMHGGPVFQYLKIEQDSRDKALLECNALAAHAVQSLLTERFNGGIFRSNEPHVACIESVEVNKGRIVIQTPK